MKTVCISLFAILVLVASCRKSQERESEIRYPTVASSALADPCDLCINTGYDPACCCVITLIASSPAYPNIQLCGTVTPAPAVVPCPGFTPPSGCATLVPGPYREAAVNPDTLSHLFCAAQGYVYAVRNIGTGGATVVITCYSGGAPTSSDTLTVMGGAPVFMTVDSHCNPVQCL